MCLPGKLKKDMSSYPLSGQGWKLDTGNFIWWSLGTLTVPLTCQSHASLCTFTRLVAMMLSLLPCFFLFLQYRMPNVQCPTFLNNPRWNTFAGTLAQGFLQITASSSFPTNPNPLFFQFSSDQLLSRVRLFATPWVTACQASLSITNSRSSPKLMCIESVMPSNHLIICHPLLLLPSIPPSIRVFSNESTLHMR